MKTVFSRFCRFSARLVLCAGLVLTLVSPGAWAEGERVRPSDAECARLDPGWHDLLCAQLDGRDDNAECSRLYVADQKSAALPSCWRAAENGWSDAQSKLCIIYHSGADGVNKAPVKAAKWCRMAAARGIAPIQHKLSYMYEYGEGVIPDKREAYIWLLIANSKWEMNFGSRRERLERELTASELNSARAEAKKRLAAIEAGTYGKNAATSPSSAANAPKNGSATPAQTAFENVWRSVVLIETNDSQGSGVIVRPNIVATNCHVIESAKTIHVYKAANKQADKSTSFRASIRGFNFDRDLCLLDVAGLNGASAQVRNADSLAVGESVYAVGAPDGLDLSLSSGVVSQLRREGYGAPTVQTDAAISPGSSGGALADASGYVVAITTRKRVGEHVEGITFAVPIEWVLEMLE